MSKLKFQGAKLQKKTLTQAIFPRNRKFPFNFLRNYVFLFEKVAPIHISWSLTALSFNIASEAQGELKLVLLSLSRLRSPISFPTLPLLVGYDAVPATWFRLHSQNLTPNS